MTNDVCCHCWGSGDRHRPWRDLRKLQQQLHAAQARERRLREALEIVKQWCCKSDRTHIISSVWQIAIDATKEAP
jgi:hypothetical protein